MTGGRVLRLRAIQAIDGAPGFQRRGRDGDDEPGIGRFARHHHPGQRGSSGDQSSRHPSFAPSISADGSVVAFESTATNLVTGDTNEMSDVFVNELSGPPAGGFSVDDASTKEGSRRNSKLRFPSPSPRRGTARRRCGSAPWTARPPSLATTWPGGGRCGSPLAKPPRPWRSR